MSHKMKSHPHRFDGAGFMRRYAADMARYEAEESTAAKRQLVTVKGRLITALPQSAALPAPIYLVR